MYVKDCLGIFVCVLFLSEKRSVLGKNSSDAFEVLHNNESEISTRQCVRLD